MLKQLNSDQLFTAVILIFGASLLMISGALVRFDHVFYDVGQYLSAQEAPGDVVIVAIDEKSLDALGKWPWSRETHATMLRALSESKPLAVGFDVLFSEPDNDYPQDDALLAAAIKAAGNVVLPVAIDMPYQDAPLTQTNTMPLLVAQAAAVGRVNVPLDVDGIARSIYLWEGVANEKGGDVLGLPHFSQSVLKVAGLLPEQFDQPPPMLKTRRHFGGRALSNSDSAGQQKVQFYGGPNAIKQISYLTVWSGEAPADFFRNKIVLVGATAVGMGDLLVTPVSSFSKPMTGVEFNANAIQTMRQSEFISDVPFIYTVLLAALLVVMPVFWMPKTRPFMAFAMILAYMLLLIAFSLILPTAFNWWFPPSAVLLMVLLAYPIWSWRRLERAHTYLTAELVNLQNDLMQFGQNRLPAEVPTDDDHKFKKQDLLQSRIDQVKYASTLLRDLQKNRNDTLAFISHDIRMPLATAVMLLNEPKLVSNRLKVIDMLEQANSLADAFLSISKAETANSANFNEVELNGLMQEVVDNLYEIARGKSIKLVLTVCDDALWINGDFSLLQRAFANIINNAIKFSPENTEVAIVLSKDVESAMIKIQDQGVGIPADKLSAIFKQYKQVEMKGKSIQGSGLGLYFVDVTIKKHDGAVSVESEIGTGTAFTFTLPLLEDTL